ncbi:MAG: PSD1 domain-containing protein [Acidobacteria bacterium]|nr:PSD1 domain-containing protein [Acidobacteriota bacterium]
MRNTRKTDRARGRNTPAFLKAMAPRAAAFALLVLLPWLAQADVSFNREIRPIMSDTCFKCHGPDKGARMAGLRLDLREEALKATPAGVTPIVPGKPEQSAIIDRIFTPNAARLMPPKYAHKDLTAAQKETIRRWVAEGARYEGHWAYEPVRRPPVPQLHSPKAPLRNPIDAFVQSRLEREGLDASPEAGRVTLIRRLSLDLTGLPPSPQQVDAFLKDTSADAYEKLAARLLESPRYAEKQAMHWLDAVRYADTCGFHGDNPFPAWPYRDYVLRAFRDNKPFDEFTREQLAGDLLPGASIEQKIASAYNRMNRTSAEGGVQPKEYLAKYAADRVRTTSSVWLGSTMGCAECHDHKFDPFTARDFYSFKAFFADIKETGLVPDRGPKAWGSQLSLATQEQQQRLAALKEQLATARRSLEEKAKQLAPQRAEWEKDLLSRFESGEFTWRYQRPTSAETLNGAKLTIYNDEPVEANSYTGASLITERKPGNGLVVAGGPNPENETYIVTLKPGEGAWTALGLEVVQDESLPGIRVARGADRLVVTGIEAEAAGNGQPSKIAFALATASFHDVSPEYPPLGVIDGDPKTAWGIATYGENRNLFLALRFAGKLKTQADSILTVRIRHDSEYRRATVGRFRLALSAAEHSWPEPEDVRKLRKNMETGGLADDVLAALRAPEEKRTRAHNKALDEFFQWASNELQPLVAEIDKLEAEAGMFEAAIPRVVVTEATTPAITRILPRGNWMDDSGEAVEPAIPAFLGKLETGGARATRLDLANWLVSPDNPLTARVFVNRLWRQFFGAGLSKVLDDLGSQGGPPFDPELLDWLAAELIKPEWNAEGAHAWDVKHLVRAIVTSHTYRQTSMSNKLESRDPDNRLLARQNRFRVDAELVRDVALSVSGLMKEKFGGPSVRPYQPEGYLAALNFPKRDYSASRGDDLYRRGVYTIWQRTFLHPSMMTFDAPTREECAINRVNSNTPLQALVLLNDPTYVEAARVFAQNILEQGGRTLVARLNWAFLRALNRKPLAAEQRTLLLLYQKNLARFQASPQAALELAAAGDAPVPQGLRTTELAAMTTIARAILNLHETITRN